MRVASSGMRGGGGTDLGAVVRKNSKAADRSVRPTRLFSSFFLDIDVQARDFLVEGRQRDVETLGCVGLVPVTFFQHFDDDLPFAIFHDVEQRCVGATFEGGECGGSAGDLIGKKLGANVYARGEHDGALDYVFQFAYIP